jgi:hypothetical protein
MVHNGRSDINQKLLTEELQAAEIMHALILKRHPTEFIRIH